jgi:hypothetical protein
MDAIADHSPPRRRWLQFSLRSMLVLVLLAAIGFSLWTSNRQRKEIRRLQDEVKQLKNEVGDVVVEEGQEHKLHALALPTLEDNTWKWRVYVPAGRYFAVSAESGVIPPSGKSQATSRSKIGLSAGEQTITVALRRNDEGRWEWIIATGSATGRLQASSDKKMSGRNSSSSNGVVRNTVAVEPGTSIDLLRHRMFSRDDPSTAAGLDGPGEGILVTIGEAK